MNLNHGYIFDPDTGLVYCSLEEHLCLECQRFVIPGYEKPDETYAMMARWQGPSYATRLPTAEVLADGMLLSGPIVVQASSPGPQLGAVMPDGWAAVSTAHGQGNRARCQRCRVRTCQTVVTGEIRMTWSRPMAEAVAHIRDRTHIFDRLGVVPS